MRCYQFFFFSLLLFKTFFSFSQERQTAEFGKPSESDFALKIYEKDTTAAAVILFEQGYYEFEIVGDYIRLIKNVFRKVKVFDSKRFDGGTVDIPLLVANGTSERVTRYNALTHNGPIKTYVAADAIFVTNEKHIGKVCRIVFPNVKNGSIIEYTYRLESPFFFNFNGWEFQGDLPKIYSEFVSKIPGNFNYNQVLYGSQKIDLKKQQVETNCLSIMGGMVHSPCNVSLFAMFDVPAFKTEEYMLSPANYISKVEYEPYSFIDYFGGNPKIFTRDWKDVEKAFKKGDYIRNQLNKTGFFKRHLPDSIRSKTDELERAKAIYTYIQKHYTWDGAYYSLETEVKDAFDAKKGSVPEINLSLINALEATGLNVKLMLLSTRQNGLPTDLYPVMTKFNYTIAVLTIANETYLLDATDKQAPFGIIPFRTLNVQGRVMDFKNGSYWMPIEPFKQNIHYANAQITAETNGNFKGKVNQASYGYIALGKRNSIEEESLQEHIKTQEKDKAGIEIEDYNVENVSEIEKPLKENYNVTIEPETVGDKVILYPFFNKTYISENPFKMKERSYPMDFGFPFSNTYLISIDLGNVYEVEQLPKSRTIKLPNDDGECLVTYATEGSNINIRFNMKLNAYRFPSDAYQSLKEYFGTIITILKEESIVLKKL
ncbi:MAG: hypothetical protein KDC94_06935 [Aequorivita sp.]|nr:hypothetical protein [Aequorivita sp.]